MIELSSDLSAIARQFTDKFAPSCLDDPEKFGSFALEQLICCLHVTDHPQRQILDALVKTYKIDVLTVKVGYEPKYTPLGLCVRKLNFNLAIALIEDHGADVNVNVIIPAPYHPSALKKDMFIPPYRFHMTKEGTSVLNEAASHRGNGDASRFVAFAIDHGAWCDSDTLSIAAEFGSREVVEKLCLECDVDVNHVNVGSGHTVLDRISKYYVEHNVTMSLYRYGIYQFLVSRGAKHSPGSQYVLDVKRMEELVKK